MVAGALAGVLLPALGASPRAAAVPLDPIDAFVAATVPIPSNDVAYDAARDVVLASVPSSHPSLGNELVELDPETGVVGRHVFVGSEPRAIALSDDGSTAFVALGGASAVAVVDLAAFTASSFPIAVTEDGPRHANDLKVVPGRNDLVVTQLADRVLGLGRGRRRLTRDGVALPQQVMGSLAPTTGWWRCRDALFGYESQTSANGQFRLVLGAQGVATATRSPNGPWWAPTPTSRPGPAASTRPTASIIHPISLAVQAEFEAAG